jgi:hypothetical protein
LLACPLFSPALPQNVSDQDLQKHIAGAELVVVGKVSEVRPMPEASRPRSMSEHDPQWQESVVEVESVLKGSSAEKRVVILFPGSIDVAWFGVPKSKVGQEGIWIVRRDQATKAYAVADPSDFLPRAQLDRVRKLIPGTKR